jgi:hypothetical protein
MFGALAAAAGSALGGLFGGSGKSKSEPKKNSPNINWNELGDFVLKAGNVAAPVLASVFGKPGNNTGVNPYMPWNTTFPFGLNIPGITIPPNIPPAAPAPAPPVIVQTAPASQPAGVFGLDNQTLLMLGGGLLLIVLLKNR